MRTADWPGSLKDLWGGEGHPPVAMRDVRRFLEEKAREKGIPLNGVFELTPLCNLDCRMCYVHLTREQMGQRALLPAERWRDLMDQAVRAGMMYATLTGGECLAYADFDQTYLHLLNQGVRVSVLTNGLLLDEKRVAFFSRYPAASIQLSVYGTDEDAYERVTGRRVFAQVMKNLNLAREAGLPLRLAVTPSRCMGAEDEKLIRLAEQTSLPFSVNRTLYPAREETGRELRDYDQTVEEYVRLRRVYMRSKGIRMDAAAPAYGGDAPGLRCGAGRSGFAVTWQGIMYACFSLPDIRACPLLCGFDQAWRSLEEQARNYPNPTECAACAYRGICRACAADHRAGAEPGHVNPRVCEIARRAARAETEEKPMETTGREEAAERGNL